LIKKKKVDFKYVYNIESERKSHPNFDVDTAREFSKQFDNQKKEYFNDESISSLIANTIVVG
jgi:hypothetical protein